MGRKGAPVFPADEGGDGGGDSLGKKPPTGFWSWMVMDASGHEMILEVDKHTIMRRVQIHARDFRILDLILAYPSTILVRGRAIVLNLEHIKAIITSEEVLLQSPFDEKVTPVVEELRRQIQLVNERLAIDGGELLTKREREIAVEADPPFEFKVLEVALEAICSYLNACSIELEAAVYPALEMLTSKISSRNFDGIRKLKSKMTRLTARVQKQVRDEIGQLLEHDDDMADLYLTRRAVDHYSQASRISLATSYGDENHVEELEMLLEVYFIQIEGTLNKLATLREYIDSTDDYINIQLDSHRNQLIQLDFFLSTATLSLSIFALVTSLFGENIPYTWNTGHGYMFKWVVLFTGTCCAFLFISVVSYAHHKRLVGSS